MNVRRSAAVLAATAVIGTATPVMAASPSPSPSVAIPSGLYGTTDPTYDGVWRQSLALIAQFRVDVKPAAKAINWLVGQQCANGAFAAFRAEPATACDAKVMADTNSTAAAVQALSAVGEQEVPIKKAVTWLKSVQNKDGGWGYLPGGPSDANSTAVVIGALNTWGDSEDVKKDGKSPYDALLDLALPCTDSGAFAYQPDKKGKLTANADATAAAVVGALDMSMVTARAAGESADPVCTDASDLTPEQAATNGASYLAESVKKDGYLKSALAGAEDRPDYGNTADAVVALAVTGGPKAAQQPLTWLEQNSADWAKQNGPAAYAQLILAASVAGADPRDFGGTDLVKQLNATGPEPKATAPAEEKKDEDDGGVSVWWIIGVGLVAGIGVGFLISSRNKGQQL
ncbi:prenyltransferase/squalene oxidase repeat-containing protein [Streptomyces sp. P17]|uniref:prenyltransferase/squalene oxidase repeat-containing protein n=1 Tax=Streptomyces sp. P17 TaxID=3074716 RepID=UPI0028F412B7|nr:prenyltransferase/squalene oxidase repeat-containing protein [Streptomyces sp. P17]MDT9698509.1 terpene cyclase/mutase family protein [Streptomyces sp. P17]